MKPIGGFFELESYHGKEYYPELIKLNTARNCFEYILQAKRYKKVYLPRYTCDVMLEPINKLGIGYEFYSINESFDPIFDQKVSDDECFVYNNYFGLKNKTVERLAGKINNLVVDNAQAFFSRPLKNIDTIYSIRKFFGVPDGAYLHTNKLMNDRFEQDLSYERMQHLLKRIDIGPEKSYANFVTTDKSLENNPIKKMSSLTASLLSNINYQRAKEAREENFLYVHENLRSSNKLPIDTDKLCGPMVYPYMVYRDDLQKHLINNKIFVPAYWPNTLEWCDENMLEFKFAKYIIPLPIDQRYDKTNMKKIVDIIYSLGI